MKQVKPSEALGTIGEIVAQVKFLLGRDDGVEAARPCHCVACGAAAHRADGRLRLQGHGVRQRTVWGRQQPDGAPAMWDVVIRRFRCTDCRAARTVQPPGLTARLRYTLPAVALALMAWGLWCWPAAQVREYLSPLRLLGASAAEQWRSLRRWAWQVEVLFGLPTIAGATARARASRAAHVVRARGPTDAPVIEQVFIGATAG